MCQLLTFLRLNFNSGVYELAGKFSLSWLVGWWVCLTLFVGIPLGSCKRRIIEVVWGRVDYHILMSAPAEKGRCEC